jgi:hypothetical protein
LKLIAVSVIIACVFAPGVSANTEMAVTEFQARRARAMKLLPDGLLMLHARSNVKGEDQSSFRQDANFYYFTGLENAVGAILAIDAPARESWLFIPDKLSGLAGMIANQGIKPARNPPRAPALNTSRDGTSLLITLSAASTLYQG